MPDASLNESAEAAGDPALAVPPDDIAATSDASDTAAPVAVAQNNGGMPIWPWAVGGLAALGVAGFGMTMRRRREAEAEAAYGYDAPYADPYADPAPEPLGYASEPVPEPVEAFAEAEAVEAPAPLMEPAPASAPILATGAALKQQDEAAEQAMLRAEVAKMEAQLRDEAAAAGAPEPVFAESIGYHEARVDEGPTPENPFKTRKARLKRARQLDRMAAEEAAPPVPPVATKVAAKVGMEPVEAAKAGKVEPVEGAAAPAPTAPTIAVGSLTERMAAKPLNKAAAKTATKAAAKTTATRTPTPSRPRAALQQTAAPRTTRTISFGSKHKFAN